MKQEYQHDRHATQAFELVQITGRVPDTGLEIDQLEHAALCVDWGESSPANKKLYCATLTAMRCASATSLATKPANNTTFRVFDGSNQADHAACVATGAYYNGRVEKVVNSNGNLAELWLRSRQ
jgi:hypothetical protein